mgnify:CR=1 FL=1
MSSPSQARAVAVSSDCLFKYRLLPFQALSLAIKNALSIFVPDGSFPLFLTVLVRVFGRSIPLASHSLMSSSVVGFFFFAAVSKSIPNWTLGMTSSEARFFMSSSLYCGICGFCLLSDALATRPWYWSLCLFESLLAISTPAALAAPACSYAALVRPAAFDARFSKFSTASPSTSLLR